MAHPPDDEATDGLLWECDGVMKAVMGIPIVNIGLSATIPTPAFNHPDGPQDLYVGCGDPVWLIENTSTPRRARLIADCDFVRAVLLDAEDAAAGMLHAACDGAGNVYISRTDTNPGTAKIKRITTAGVVDVEEIDVYDELPATITHPVQGVLTKDARGSESATASIYPQESGCLIVATWSYSKVGYSQIRQYWLIKVADDLTVSTALLQKPAWLGANSDGQWDATRPVVPILPLSDGLVVESVRPNAGNINQATWTVNSSGAILAEGPPINVYRGTGTGELFEWRDHEWNWWISLEEDVPCFWARGTVNVVGSTYDPIGYAKINLDTLADETPLWFAETVLNKHHSIRVSPSGHRIGVMDATVSPRLWKVYAAGGLQLLQAEHTNSGVWEANETAWANPWYYVQGSQGADDYRIATRRASPSSTYTIRKYALDSILMPVALAKAQTSRLNRFFVRGQWPHFSYSTWV